MAPGVSGSNVMPIVQLVVIAPVQVLLAIVKSVVSPVSASGVAEYVVPPFAVIVFVTLVEIDWLPNANGRGVNVRDVPVPCKFTTSEGAKKPL